jgi:hypothetical protein
MPPKSSEPSEADVIFTRASVALAKSQRLIASWLPAKTDEEIARENSNADDDEDRFETGTELYVHTSVDTSSHCNNALPFSSMPFRFV